MTKAAEIATAHAREQSDARIADRVKIIEDSGTKIITLSDETREEIRSKASAVYEKIKNAVREDLYNSYMN